MTGSRPLVQVVTSTDRRGAEVFGTQLGETLARRGWDTRSVALSAGCVGATLAIPALGRRPLSAATLLALRRATTGALAVAHGSTTLPACALATAAAGGFVYRNIGDPGYWAGSPVRRARVGLLLRRARAVVALSDLMADVLVGSFRVRRDRVFVIPNAVPASEFPAVDAVRRAEARAALGIGPAVAVVAYIGALSVEKDAGAAIEAVARLEGVTLLVLGDGPERGPLAELARTTAGDRVRFLGTSPLPAAVLAAADALILPSRTEGMPAVLIEAGLSGLPVVATRVGAVGEVVVDGETGVLVAPGDRPALADALGAVLAGPGAVAMGGRARVRCLARFDIEVVAGAWEDMLWAIA